MIGPQTVKYAFKVFEVNDVALAKLGHKISGALS